MPRLKMNGPFEFTADKINEFVIKKSPGNYALGYTAEKTFLVRCIGRSDTDVKQALLAKVGERYKKFKFSYSTSAQAAFEKECNIFHDFGERVRLDNNRHPEPPQGAKWKCPICEIFNE